MHILRDAQYALRNLVRTPAFTVVVVSTLALGIGASTAIFTVVHAVVVSPLDYPEPHQLARITSELRNLGGSDTGISAGELTDYQALTETFAGVAGMLPVNANATSGDRPERVEMLLVSWNYFDVLGVAPLHGRVFGPEDDSSGVANIAVVSHRYWRSRLGASPAAIGRRIDIDGDQVLVVGVMPAGFEHPGRTLQGDVQIWSPAGFRSASDASMRSGRRLEGALVRLRRGLTIEQAQVRLAEFGRQLAEQHPTEYPARNGWRPLLVPLQDDVVGRVATPMFLLLTGVGLLLLVACANVAHLVLARSSARRQEWAIRRALGASAGRLTWQLATESALLTGAGGLIGMLVASWTLRGLIALAPGRVPRLDEVSIDLGAMITAGAISLGATLLFGFVPALRIRRLGTYAALKDGGRHSDAHGARLRASLVVAEVAMATVLLIGAGLLVRSVIGLLNVPVGFDTDRLYTARLTLPRPNDPARAMYLDPERRLAFYEQTLERLAALPGIEHAALSSQIPLGGFRRPLFVQIDALEDSTQPSRPVMHAFDVSTDYFSTLRIPLVAGRPFADTDRTGTEPVAIVSEAAVRMFWQDRSPIGSRVRFSTRDPWMTVVGVAGDVLNRRLTEAPQPLIYRPLAQASDLSMALLIRSRGSGQDLATSVARAVSDVDAQVPVYAVQSMAALIEGGVAQRQFLMRVLTVFGAVATALALLGIYGTMAYIVSQRTREIGIRMAIGARQSDISRLVMRRGMALTCWGVAAGIVLSLPAARFVRSQLFGVQPADPLTVMSVLAMMTTVAAAAAYLPARRAARVDPVIALRAE